MEWLEALAIILTTIGIRFLIPIILTIGIVYFLRQLDARWQAEAKELTLLPESAFEGPRCYEVNGCSPEQMEKCPVPTQSQPCWQVFRNAKNGRLQERCLSCKQFTQAPVPAGIYRLST
ncbi:MAG: hypothetical protein ISR59_07260 [Anaerolineales bacterium]|nr:hypothetical protein [Anaerolineales bacterium]